MKKESRNKLISVFVTALCFLAVPGIAFACSYAIGPGAIGPGSPTEDQNAERNFYGQFFFIGVWVFLTANILFAAFTRKKYLLGIVLPALAVPIQFVALIFTLLLDSCGNFYHLSIRIELWILSLALVAQIIWFVKMRRRESSILP